ncbi:MAG: LamG domain-containing protein, partial [Candidatus Pacearchaeota archaeon]|nr:LamG domain-containing protein [Candidatus Pacearchaeota archaeon]
NVNCDVEGINGEACEFDGDGDYILLGDASSYVENTDFSLFFWYNNKETSSVSYKGVLEFGYFYDGGTSGGGHEWGLNTNDDYFRVNFRNTSSSSGDKPIYIDDGWHQYGVSFVDTSGEYILYKDGEIYSEGISSVKKIMTNTDEMRFGSRDDNTFVEGIMDEIIIFDRVLTEEQVEWLYEKDLG